MNRLNLRRETQDRSAQAARDARLLHLHEAGVPVSELAKRFGMDRLTFWERIDRAIIRRDMEAYPSQGGGP